VAISAFLVRYRDFLLPHSDPLNADRNQSGDITGISANAGVRVRKFFRGANTAAELSGSLAGKTEISRTRVAGLRDTANGPLDSRLGARSQRVP
jgi:hypothetical protein